MIRMPHHNIFEEILFIENFYRISCHKDLGIEILNLIVVILFEICHSFV